MSDNAWKSLGRGGEKENKVNKDILAFTLFRNKIK
jgi:hypothetical protein